jgi:hypothetical protein
MMAGINPSEKNPNLPKTWQCGACEYTFDIPRAWVKTKNMGWQIVVNWKASEFLIESHMAKHDKQLITEIEDWLDAGT